MTPVLTTERLRPPKRPALRTRVAAVLVGAALGVVMLVLLVQLEAPPFVDAVTVVNDTSYRFNVAVSGDDGEGVVQLGAIGRGGQNQFEAVLDQGDVWAFHFDYGGVDGGVLRLTRDELEATGWTIQVPASAGQLVHDAGLVPSAQYL